MELIEIGDVQSPWRPCQEVVRQGQDCRGSIVVASVRPDKVQEEKTPPAKARPAKGRTKAARDTTKPEKVEPLTGSIVFKSTVNLRGTTSFNVLYAGKDLDAKIRSSWPTPSFVGDVLPENSTVTADGFESRWQISGFGAPRLIASSPIMDPAMWKGSAFGVELIEATPIYRMVTRVAKYGLLFVVLAFATYLFFELLAAVHIHVIQYGMVALSMSLFGLLLLSLSEPIGYTPGYVVSAGLVLLQSTLYTAAVTKRIMPALVFAAMLSILFVLLYVLLGLETYALLSGAMVLFAVVSLLMVLTQRLNRPNRPAGAGAPAAVSAAP
jgi:inner membrane protein